MKKGDGYLFPLTEFSPILSILKNLALLHLLVFWFLFGKYCQQNAIFILSSDDFYVQNDLWKIK